MEQERTVTSFCPHRKYSDNHCGEMTCWNYYSKCPKHSPSGRPDEICSIEKMLDKDKRQ